MRAFAIVAVLTAAASASAAEQTWIVAGVGAQTVSPRMLGEVREIAEGVALSPADGDGRWFVPRIGAARDLNRDATLGIDVSAAWFRDSFAATSSTPIEYSVRRDVFPVTALLRYTPKRPHSVLLAVGPTVALTRFEEHGWLGDGVVVHPAFGGQLRFGGRATFVEQLRLTYGLFLQWMQLPRENLLIADGGSATMGGVDFAFEFCL